ncbi:MAG: biotin/lipoyl-containing protein [Leptospiraceae bacterium]|nr:biotin/lipoyl-containing protein [Leptospiraceae bacterium]
MKINLKSSVLYRKIWVSAQGIGFFDEQRKIPELESYDLEISGNSFSFMYRGESVKGKFAFEGETLVVAINGYSYSFEPLGDFRSQHEVGGGEFRAQLPGKVLRLNVQKGSLVKKDDVLLVLEAMKMEHAVRALGDAEVVDVYVQEGMQVAEGELLVLLKPLDQKENG